MLWYFLCLSIKHNVKWCIWSGENSSGQLTRDLIQMYAQCKLTKLTKSQIDKYNNKISEWFTFVSNKKMYNHKDLLKLFKESNFWSCELDNENTDFTELFLKLSNNHIIETVRLKVFGK